MPLCSGFSQLNQERFARRLAKIRAGRTHEFRSVPKLPQLLFRHFAEPRSNFL
jgi:hypothetical protein